MKAIKTQPSPFIEVIKSAEVVRFKPAVERSMKRSLQGKDLSPVYENVEDLFKALNI